MTPPPTFKPDDIELVPDSWERFERAVDTVSKGGPQHRSASPKQQIASGAPAGEAWEEWGFDESPGSVEVLPLSPSNRQEESPSQRRVVVAYFRQTENEAELIFPRP
jgi:hypothetical protein